MEGLIKFSLSLMVFMLVIGSMTSEGAISCGAVNSNLAQCIGYLTKGGSVPKGCCIGVKKLNDMARTTPNRRQACHCIQGAAKALGSRLNTARAARLPAACRVKIGYPISIKTKCNTVM